MKNLLVIMALVMVMVSCQSETSNAAQHDQKPQTEIKSISYDQLAEMGKKENVVILDVRTPEECAQGFITGTQKFINYNSSSFKDQVNTLDKEKTYIVYCKSGNRSTKSLRIMRDNGFENLYELEGGISAAPSGLITLEKN